VIRIVVWAQAVDPTGEVAAIVTLITQIGLSAVFLWQWQSERRERRELQATMLKFIERYGPALENSTSTLERVQAGMASQVERAAMTPDQRGFDLSMRRLELTVDELGAALRQTRRRKEDYE
jgi:hypothetical protein